jgi:geranylgeranyl diphosphate synthase type I
VAEESSINKSIARVRRSVEERLLRFFDDIGKKPPAPIFETHLEGPILAQVRELTMRGGKRLRAGLLVYGAALFEPGWPPKPAVLDAAAAIELLHTYFLIHDDIMDHDDVRRGGPAVHAALADVFGDREKGRDFAILAGDLAASMYGVLIGELKLADDRFRRLSRVLAAMHLDVVHGQTLDMLAMSSPYDIAYHKTASYTTMGPLAAGAALGGASDDQVQHLALIARPLGVAFQFRDDLLGTFGLSEDTGKSAKSDLSEGKRTILLDKALSLASPEEKESIEAVLGNRNATSEAIETAREALEQCGAREACQEQIEMLVEEFVTALDNPVFAPEARSVLVGLARFVALRNI